MSQQRLFSSVIQVRIAWSILILSMIIYALWIGDQAVLRYTTFQATGFDLGNQDQAVWNTLHGRFFQFTNHGSNWYGHPIRLAQHVEPILLPLSLLYLIAPDPRTLLIFQTLALTAGALPVFLLTRRFVPTWPLLAPIMALAYLLSPAVISGNTFDFHAVTLSTPFFLYALLALTYRRFFWFVLFCILAAGCKEETPTVMALLGLLVVWKYKLPRLGLALFILGVVWSALAFLVIMPHFNIGAKQSNFWYRYAALGSTPGEAIKNVLLQPWILLVVFVTVERVYYLLSLLRSPGFLALLAPEWLLPTLPNLAINLLSMEHFQHSGVFHYNAAIVPFVMLASIHGVRRLVLFWHTWRGESEEAEQLRESAVLMIPPRHTGTQKTLTEAIPGSAVLLKSAGWLWGRVCALGHALARRQPLRSIVGNLQAHRTDIQARRRDLAATLPVARLQKWVLIWIVGMISLNLVVMHSRLDTFWPDHRPGEREQRVEQVLALIPEDAPVSASGTLNPHLTERRYITVFPELTVATMDSGEIPVEYIVIDLQNVSPESKARSAHFMSVLNMVISSQEFHVLAQSGGVLLLGRTTP